MWSRPEQNSQPPQKSGTRLETQNLELDDLGTMTNKNGSSPVGDLLDKEFSKKLKDCVMNLSPLQREVLLLRETEELSYREIAEITDTNIGVVKGRLHRARQMLVKELAPYVKGDEVQIYEVQ